jgi:ABC-type antimicrobial peptide transport system permease subunit
MRPFATLAVETSGGSPALLARGITSALREVDPRVSLTFRPFAERVASAMALERVVALVSTVFGMIAALVAGIGLYGVTSYAVTRRRAEIGVRMALGADALGVVRLVLGGIFSLLALGIAIGAAASLGAASLIGSLLYGLEPRDPLALAAAAAALAAVGLAAAALPARRATRIEPAKVLREG